MGSLRLAAIAPFRLDLTVWALRRRPINAVDRWDGRVYRRVLTVADSLIEVCVEQEGTARRPGLRATITGGQADARTKAVVSKTLRRMLGLDVDLRPFYRLAKTDKRLAELAGRFEGLKPPRFESAFEGLVNGISCQQLSLHVGLLLLNRLAQAFAPRLGAGHSFPRPRDLAGARVAQLRSLGYSAGKAAYIIGLAKDVVAGELDLKALEEQDDVSAAARLLEVRGVGRWTADYVLLRGLGRLDVIPADDVGSQANLQRWRGLRARPGYEAMHRVVDRFSPYRGLIYFHLLLDALSRKGRLAL